MYKKLTKSFISKNISLFVFLSIAITLCLFGFLFSDSLSKNFLEQIENDAQKNLWWDIVVDLWSADQQKFDRQLEAIMDENTNLAKEYNIQSSYKLWSEISPANILFVSEKFPFYDDFSYKTINPNGKMIVSEDLYKKSKNNTIEIFEKKIEILWFYQNFPSSIWSFFSQENIFIPMEYFSEIISDDKNIFFEKKYYFQFSDNESFTKIRQNLENLEKKEQFRLNNYQTWWDRFWDIVTNIRWYINFSILFALILTCVILFISLRSFFIQERKNLSVLRVLGMNNFQFWWYFVSIFGILFAASLFLAFVWVQIGYQILQHIPETKGFAFQASSFFQACVILLLLMIIWVWFPLYQFISSSPNSGFSENFFSLFEKKQRVLFGIIFVLGIIIFALILGYTWKIIAIFLAGLSVFLVIFFYGTKWLNSVIYKIYSQRRQRNFEIFDALRSTNKPGNISFLLQVSFFTVFFIGFFIFLFAWNFSNRLQVNLDSDNNFFVLNIDEESYKNIDEQYKSNTFSIFRGRIKSINDLPLKEFLKNNPTGRFSREFNITDNPLENVSILRGKELKSGMVSVDDNFADDLWIDLWDRVTFQIFWLEKELEVVNIRQSEDFAINPFFYFQVYPGDFENFPKQYFLSERVEIEKIPEIKQYFYDVSGWTVQFIEVDKILVELKEISQKVLGVIQVLFVYISAFSLLAIIVIIWFYSRFSKQKSRLYYLLGSTKKQNTIRQFVEFFSLSFSVFLLWILLSSFWVYYILNISEFIEFSGTVFGNNLLIFSGVYALFLFILLRQVRK